jgi:hypothetical protein
MQARCSATPTRPVRATMGMCDVAGLPDTSREQDEIRRLGRNAFQRLGRRSRLLHPVAGVLEEQPEGLAEQGIIFDQKDRTGGFRHSG